MHYLVVEKGVSESKRRVLQRDSEVTLKTKRINADRSRRLWRSPHLIHRRANIKPKSREAWCARIGVQREKEGWRFSIRGPPMQGAAWAKAKVNTWKIVLLRGYCHTDS